MSRDLLPFTVSLTMAVKSLRFPLMDISPRSVNRLSFLQYAAASFGVPRLGSKCAVSKPCNFLMAVIRFGVVNWMNPCKWGVPNSPTSSPSTRYLHSAVELTNNTGKDPRLVCLSLAVILSVLYASCPWRKPKINLSSNSDSCWIKQRSASISSLL